MSLAGHLWTLKRYTPFRERRRELPPGRPWSAEVEGPRGSITLTGRLRPEGESLLLIVHGLGGCADSDYVPGAEVAAVDAGMASLALNVRGADRRGGDYGHAAMTADLEATLRSPALDRYERIHLIGYSLGGHLSLRYATEEPDPRVRSIASICAPLDLSGCCDFIDRPEGFIYRHYLLRRLMDIYAAVARETEVPLPLEEARRIRYQREFDDRLVAPHHGFEDVDDYYRQASVGPRLDRLRVPTLFVAARADPMVPAETLEPFLALGSPELTVRWVRGGHVGFPSGLDLGEPGPRGLEPQVLSWLASTGRDGARA